jgi:hypothetical protein
MSYEVSGTGAELHMVSMWACCGEIMGETVHLSMQSL